MAVLFRELYCREICIRKKQDASSVIVTTTLDDDGASTSFWNRAPRVASLTSIVWLAALMIAFSNTGISWPLSMAFLVSGAALLGWWLLRFIIAAIRLRNRSLIRKAAHFWTVVPLCLVFGMGISLSSIPLMVRLYFSADALVASAPALASVPNRSFLNMADEQACFESGNLPSLIANSDSKPANADSLTPAALSIRPTVHHMSEARIHFSIYTDPGGIGIKAGNACCETSTLLQLIAHFDVVVRRNSS